MRLTQFLRFPKPALSSCSSRVAWAATVVLGPLLLLLAPGPSPLCAQGIGTREYPPQEYYLAFRIFDNGDFVSALDAFRASARSGLRSSEGRWVDSICYHTMMGECFYRMGNLSSALDQYSRALNLFVGYSNWMIRVDFAPGVDTLRRTRRLPNWGVSTRRAVAGQFMDRYPILQGRLDNENVIVRGGIFALPEYMLVNAHEIARCTALASSRRREIMGSVCEHDQLTRQVFQAISVRPGRAGHWSQAWIDVQLGMAAAAAGRTEQAINDLGNGILAGGFDHPLTPLALLELGKLAFEQSQYGTAANFFHEASLSGAAFEQYAVIEEALQRGALTHLVGGGQGPYPALAPAAGWARRESRYLEASLLVSAAEQAAVFRQTPAAVGLLEDARRRMARTEMGPSIIGARHSYVTALVHYQAGKLQAGDAAFSNLMKFQRQGSTRLKEISLVDQFYQTGTISDRIANLLYAKVLREPTPTDWMVSPVETQTVLLSPLGGPMERWLHTSLARREYEAAAEIADRIRRHRFFSSLPMGGRLLSLRWMFEGPESELGKDGVLQRQSLMAEFPGFAQAAGNAQLLRTRLRELGLSPGDEAARMQQRETFQRLRAIATEQELRLREIALRRAPAQMAFPPQLDFAAVQGQLEPGQLVVSYLITSDGTYLFRFGRDSYLPIEKLAAPRQIEAGIVRLLRGLGQLDKNQPLTAETLTDRRWQPLAVELLNQLVGGGLPEDLEELIIIPDGPLWYLPFEALQLPNEGGFDALISRFRIRYAPTVSLAVPGERPAAAATATAVVSGRLFPRDDPGVAEQAATQLAELLPAATVIPTSKQAPADLIALQTQRLIVLHDLEQASSGPYGWAPLPLSDGGRKSSLADWMSLPWGGPEQILLPGFHTAAEVSMKRGGNGNELFLATCGMMATGARTILLSRWRPGGQASFDLVREFVQELPFTTAADAWQRSVQLVSAGPIVLEREPRVSATDTATPLTSEHPFFWSGYMLIDRGAKP